VVGMSGSGKSYLVKTMLTRASFVWGSNAIILDWAGEYGPWVEATGGQVIRLGIDGTLNLLDATNARICDKVAQVASMLSMLTDIGKSPYQCMIVQRAIEAAYAKCGFGLDKAPKKGPFPTLFDVAAWLKGKWKSERGEKRHEYEAAYYTVQNMAVLGRLYFGKKSTIGLGRLAKSGLVCIDLHALPSEQMRSVVGLAVIQQLKEAMRSEEFSQAPGVRLFIVVDEAWKIAKDEASDLVSIVREGRKYQFALIVAAQNPTDVSRTIMANAGTGFVFRTMLAAHRKYLMGAFGYGREVDRQVESFGVGACLVHLAFAAGTRMHRSFIVERIDGEESLGAIVLEGWKMQFDFERLDLEKRLAESGLNAAQVAFLIGQAGKSNSHLSTHAIIDSMEKWGFSKSAMLGLLRRLGLAEAEIAQAFRGAEEQKLSAQGSLTQLVAVDGKGTGKMAKRTIRKKL